MKQFAVLPPPSACPPPGGSPASAAVHHQHNHRFADNMMAGFGAGFLAVAFGFPLDVIKTRMQTSLIRKGGRQADGTAASAARKSSIWKTGRGILRKEGILGMYKGLASPLVTLSVSSSINFTAYGTFRKLYKAEEGWHLSNYLAGMSTGPISAIISTAETHVRTQMQIDNVNKKRFRNSFHCLSSILRGYGIRTLFTGWSITTMRDTAHLSTYFFVYEGVKGTLLKKQRERGNTDGEYLSMIGAIPLAGGAAGTSAWMVAYPLDCVRARLQGQCLVTKGNSTTRTAWHVFMKILQKQGIRGLFLGVTPTLVRAPFVHSIRFTAYEGFLWLFRTLE